MTRRSKFKDLMLMEFQNLIKTKNSFTQLANRESHNEFYKHLDCDELKL